MVTYVSSEYQIQVPYVSMSRYHFPNHRHLSSYCPPPSTLFLDLTPRQMKKKFMQTKPLHAFQAMLCIFSALPNERGGGG